jgi:hypothetical protein
MIITREITYDYEKCIGYRYNLMSPDVKLAYLNIIIDYEEKSSIITDFSCINTNKGSGSILLKFVIGEMIKIQIKNITLDDMSNRYRNIHNIYLKFGFKYVHEFGPEMELLLNIG